ncbi:MAM and LDL-receptor class A domain-containing protein 1-like isoform X1 [Gigantopelta aegis]|uniref:MAM and LDL-receptor class A domain-containing protein 1-like isoform X1 n=1 Tax=Gigantopelta aegis TaxID=1735272 RepID=UPI001B88DBC7|nr:MAM and LDL-receptor class A domain-containing protein 1-like isoform X1 [Gigantopelta aegis]
MSTITRGIQVRPQRYRSAFKVITGQLKMFGLVTLVVLVTVFDLSVGESPPFNATIEEVQWMIDNLERSLWGPWAKHSSCSKSCGGGTQVRTRVVTCQPVNDSAIGPMCLGPKTDTETSECNTQTCAENKDYVTETLNCDFDKDLCSWQQSTDDDEDWVRSDTPTPTARTGPGFGHTGAGWFMYFEASYPVQEGDVARLESAEITFQSDLCLQFFYHMYGLSTGSLRIKTTTKGVPSILWQRSGLNENMWKMATVTLPDSTEPYRVIIEGVRGDGPRGDIAFDDITATRGSC